MVSGPVSFSGLVSGLNTQSIISAEMAVYEQPLTNLQNEKSTINTKIWITVTATLSGKPAVHATAKYEFLFAGLVVSTQYVRYNKNFSFTGQFRDDLIFPRSAVGQPQNPSPPSTAIFIGIRPVACVPSRRSHRGRVVQRGTP